MQGSGGLTAKEALIKKHLEGIWVPFSHKHKVRNRESRKDPTFQNPRKIREQWENKADLIFLKDKPYTSTSDPKPHKEKQRKARFRSSLCDKFDNLKLHKVIHRTSNHRKEINKRKKLETWNLNQNQKEKNKQYPVDKNRSRSTEREQSDFFRNEVVVTGYSTSGQWERFWLFLLVGLFSFLLLAWEAKAKPRERERERWECEWNESKYVSVFVLVCKTRIYGTGWMKRLK